jgi:hypothetical protein
MNSSKQQFYVCALAKWLGCSNQVYNAILKFCKWLTMNCAINVVGRFLPRFYIFKSESVCDD